jgi:Flp pilus assembly pilin Flp
MAGFTCRVWMIAVAIVLAVTLLPTGVDQAFERGVGPTIGWARN